MVRLHYDNETHTTHNTQRINIIIDGFGKTSTIADLDPNGWLYSSVLEYYGPMISMLKGHGYDDKSLRGAPYDFRKAPKMYEQNDNQPVVVIGHSMGSPVMLYYYNHRPQDGKDKYLKTHISLAGVWGGTVEALEGIICGNPIANINPYYIRPAERSFPSINWFLPSDRFWGPGEVLVVTHERNYTSSDHYHLYENMADPDGYSMWKDTKDLIYELTPPGVEFHCLYGHAVPTHSLFMYAKGEFPDSLPSFQQGDGDGSINLRSLQVCLQWGSQQRQPVYHRALFNVSHMHILSDSRAFEYIERVLHINETE
ncbi:hypothetical protein ACOMHN_033808 [Nucella lapillus]